MRNLAQLENLMLCKLCESATEYFGEQRILQAFDARYLRCTRCGFVFVERPTWLEQAYELPIAAADTGIVVRNLRFADLVGALIDLALPDARQFLDFGGGAGLFVRLMRDRGYNFYRQDKYCDNIFATGFDAAAEQKFDLATCIEVIEHIVEPMSLFQQLAALAPTVLVATELLPPVRNRPGEWWYYAPEGGQHISFFRLAPCKSWLTDSECGWRATGAMCTSSPGRRSARGWCGRSRSGADWRSPAPGSESAGAADAR